MKNGEKISEIIHFHKVTKSLFLPRFPKFSRKLIYSPTPAAVREPITLQKDDNIIVAMEEVIIKTPEKEPGMESEPPATQSGDNTSTSTRPSDTTPSHEAEVTP